MTDEWKAFAGLFGDEAELALDRALAELRAGRPILLEGAGGPALVAALDAVPPSVFAVLASSDGMDVGLALSQDRARSLGLPADGPVLVPVAGLDREAIFRLAGGPDLEPPEAWSPADGAAGAGIELCKQALLLPAVLIARLSLPSEASIHRLRIDQVACPSSPRRRGLEVVSRARVPLAEKIEASFVVFRGGRGLRDQLAILVGDPDPARAVPLRLHSACLTGDLFGSLRCDCGDQLRGAVASMAAAGGGVLLYLDQEGRGTGLRNKMRAYALQDAGFDTIDADAMLGYGADERRYDMAAEMLRLLGYRRVRLLTNNPAKGAALSRAGIAVEGTEPLTGAVTAENRRYLSTKARRAGHELSDLLA